MALVVNTNVNALIAHRSLSFNAKSVQRSMERLASGFRINRAGDDAAGLNISEILTAQIRGNKQALNNAQDGVSILQIAEGALSVIGENLQRMRELTVQAGNDTNSQSQRNAIAQELRARTEDIDRIAQATQFNGISLLTGTATSASLQIGAGSTVATNTLNILPALASARASLDLPAAGQGLGLFAAAGRTFTSLNDMYNTTTGVSAGLASSADARSFLNDLDIAINRVTARRSTIGSLQNQLESVTNNLALSVENFSASNSRIKDLDVAKESSTLVQYQILQQASVSILAQANQTPQLTLSLLKQG